MHKHILLHVGTFLVGGGRRETESGRTTPGRVENWVCVPSSNVRGRCHPPPCRADRARGHRRSKFQILIISEQRLVPRALLCEVPPASCIQNNAMLLQYRWTGIAASCGGMPRRRTSTLPYAGVRVRGGVRTRVVSSGLSQAPRVVRPVTIADRGDPNRNEKLGRRRDCLLLRGISSVVIRIISTALFLQHVACYVWCARMCCRVLT